MGSDDPAAHSMDTEWFAVDAEGHVARFESGEDGAVPLDAAYGLSPTDPSFDTTLLECARLAAVLASGQDPCDNWRPAPAPGRQVVVVDPPSGYRDDARDGLVPEGFRVIRAERPLLLLSEARLEREEVEAIAARETTRWTLPTADLSEALDGFESFDGLYHYTHERGEDPGRYERRPPPAAPLEIAGLSAEAREAISSFALPLRFAEAEAVHLADHLEDAEAATRGDLPLRYPEGYDPEAPPPPAERRSGAPAWLWVALGILGIGALLGWWLSR